MEQGSKRKRPAADDAGAGGGGAARSGPSPPPRLASPTAALAAAAPPAVVGGPSSTGAGEMHVALATTTSNNAPAAAAAAPASTAAAAAGLELLLGSGGEESGGEGGGGGAVGGPVPPTHLRLKLNYDVSVRDSPRASAAACGLQRRPPSGAGPVGALRATEVTDQPIPAVIWNRLNTKVELTHIPVQRATDDAPAVLSRTTSTVEHQQQQAGRIGSISPSLVQKKEKERLHTAVLKHLLVPHTWRPPTALRSTGGLYSAAPLRRSHIEQLCKSVTQILKHEPPVLAVPAPVKIFGDIHGQYGDLMRYFSSIGTPCDWLPNGDIATCSYLFLGDWVDRGKFSLETVCMLLALKCQYPSRVFLVRGNHEDHRINSHMGFYEECTQRLGKKDGHACWAAINKTFHWLSPAAVVEKCIFCCHGGIGRIKTIDQIACLTKPCSLESLQEDKPRSEILNDLLWSDPTAPGFERALGQMQRRDAAAAAVAGGHGAHGGASSSSDAAGAAAAAPTVAAAKAEEASAGASTSSGLSWGSLRASFSNSAFDQNGKEGGAAAAAGAAPAAAGGPAATAAGNMPVAAPAAAVAEEGAEEGAGDDDVPLTQPFTAATAAAAGAGGGSAAYIDEWDDDNEDAADEESSELLRQQVQAAMAGAPSDQEGIYGNERGDGICTFDSTVVKGFLRRNKLRMIVRAHEVTMDGFDLHSDGHLVTLFSATNYCGVCGNNGAVLQVTWGSPQDSYSTERDTLILQAKVINCKVGREGGAKTWLSSQERPPTPPRKSAAQEFDQGMGF